MTKEELTQHINREIKRLFPRNDFNSWIGAHVLAVGIINGVRLTYGDNVPEWLSEIVDEQGYEDSWAS